MYNLTVADIHTYYVVAGTTPVLVHNTGCDHILLGKSQGLDATAEKIGAQTLMADANWQQSVLDAIANPSVRISVSLDGATGSSAYSKIMSAAQRGASGAGTPFDWEMSQLYNSGRLGSVTFYEGGEIVANPFGGR